MKYKKILFCLAFMAMAASQNAFAQQLAFPGAEGFGRYALGVRGVANPTVYHVTNLNDSGEGSLRDAVSQPGRIVVFDVGGVINIKSRIVFSSDLYVAGQTAPGMGVVVYGDGVAFSGANNVIIRYMRFRMGSNGTNGKDAAGIANGKNMIFDHCSVTWGLDETFSISWDEKNYEPQAITIQNSIMGQGLQTHSCGGLIQSNGGLTLWRNLYIDNKTRNNKVKGLCQWVNNVVYNWGDGGCYILGDTDGSSWSTIEDCYFIKGPVDGTAVFTRATEACQLYQHGNMLDLDMDGTLNGREATKEDYYSTKNLVYPTFVDSYDGFDWTGYTLSKETVEPTKHPKIEAQMNATDAYKWIVDNVGASLPYRDEVDAEIIDELTSLGKKGTLLTNENELNLTGSVGTVYSGKKQTDTDNDGMPDVYEDANGLDKTNAADAIQTATNGYLNIENYINSISAGQEFVKSPLNFEIASRSANSVTLGWNNEETDVDKFVVEYSTDDGKTYTSVDVDAKETNYTISDMLPLTTYLMRMYTVKKGEQSDYTSTITLTTTAGRVEALKCTTPTPADGSSIKNTKSVDLSWENVTGTDGGYLYYYVYMGTDVNNMTLVSSADGIKSTGAGSFTATIEQGTTYYWRVDAVNSMNKKNGTTTTGDVWSFTTAVLKNHDKLAYYPLDETDGITTINKVTGESISMDGGFTPAWTEGKMANCADFAGMASNQAFRQPGYDAINNLGTSDFTIEMWFKAANPTAKHDWYFLHKGSNSTKAYTGASGIWFGIQCANTSNDRLTFAVDDNKTKSNVDLGSASTNYLNDEWHHLMCVRNKTENKLQMYVDGVFVKEGTDKTGSLTTTEDMLIGNCHEAWTNAYQGKLDEVAIYEGAFTADEVSARYDDTKTTHINGISVSKAAGTKITGNTVVVSTNLPNGVATASVYTANGKLAYRRTVLVENGSVTVNGVNTTGNVIIEIAQPKQKCTVKVVK